MALRAAALGIVAAVAVAGCAPGRPGVPATGGVPAIGETLRVQHAGRVETVPIDAYAAAVALTEIAPGAVAADVAEALYEAQIVVARTYAVSRRGRHGAEGFDMCDTTHCQRYEPARLKSARWAELASRIASRTTRRVLVHDSRLIEAVFHADCGGHTADARDVWGAARPYLVAKRDAVKDPHRAWTSELDAERLAAVLSRDRRTRIVPPLRELAIVRRDGSGRAARIRLAGRESIEVDGDVFRAVVTAGLGLNALPSTRFSLRRQGDGWELRGTGFGHGVGMCQAGALSRARRGAKGPEILGFYYPGAIIRRAPAR